MIRDHPRRFLLDFLVTALLLLLCIRNIALLNGRQEGEILEPSPSTSWSGSTTHNNSGHLTRSIKPHTVFRKRAGTSYWPKALQRGNDLKCLLAMPPENFPEAQKSQWLTYDQLAQYGWESDSIPGFSAGSVAPALDFFGLSKSVPPNARIDWDHNEATTIGGVMYPATYAQYHNVYNAPEGAIYGFQGESPKYRLSEDYPANAQPPLVPLNQWSDVTFLEWQHEADANQLKDLRFIFKVNIENAPAKNVIYQAVGGQNNLGTWQNKATFSLEQDEGIALLGTPIGTGVGYILAQHKDQLGHRTVGQVYVWDQSASSRPRPDSSIHPCLLFEIGPYPWVPTTVGYAPAVDEK